MNGYLKQSTAAQVRTVGPFVDDTDFKTLENGLTIANTDILIKKNGAASGSKNSGGAAADGSGGMYHLTWDATDTASVGELSFSIKVAGALVVFGTYVVLEEAIYDALFAASANAWSGAAGSSIGVANVTQWLGSAAATPTVAGVPEVDLTHVGGTLQTAGDLAALITAVDNFIDTEIADIQARLPAALVGGRMDSSMQAMADAVITAAKFAAGAIDSAAMNVTGSEFTAIPWNAAWDAEVQSEVDDALIAYFGANAAAFVDSIWDEAVSGSRTARKAIRLLLAIAVGKVSGLGTATGVFRNPDDTLDAVTATIDADGNRSAVTLDDSA